jgi:hypothetical protein
MDMAAPAGDLFLQFGGAVQYGHEQGFLSG